MKHIFLLEEIYIFLRTLKKFSFKHIKVVHNVTLFIVEETWLCLLQDNMGTEICTHLYVCFPYPSKGAKSGVAILRAQ